MIPAMCRIKHDPPHSYGDCMRAALASVLELDTEFVPHFAHDNPSGAEMFTRMREWLRARGRNLFTVAMPPDSLEEILEWMGEMNPGVVYMLVGGTGDGDHVVVCEGDQIIHNPAWYGSSLVGPACNGELWQIMVVM